MLVVAGGLLVAYGGFDVRMEVVEQALTRLQDLPVAMERLRSDISAGGEDDRDKLRERVAKAEARLSALEAKTGDPWGGRSP